VVHENNAYSEFLYKKVIALATGQDKRIIYSFVLEDNNSLSAMLPALERIKDHTAVVVYLGYSQHAIDLLQGLYTYNIKVPIVFSDGCFSSVPDLRTVVSRFDARATLFFPSPPWSKDIKDDRHSLPGFQKFGYNAYILLAHLASATSSADAHSLRVALNAVGPALAEQGFATKHAGFISYKFNEKGEPYRMEFEHIALDANK
jgi:hypothetical protein